MLQSGTTFPDLIFMTARAHPEPATHIPEQARADTHTHTHTHTQVPGCRTLPISEFTPSLSSHQLRHCSGHCRGCGRSKDISSLASGFEYHLHFIHFMSKRSELFPSPHLSPELESRGPPARASSRWASRLLAATPPPHHHPSLTLAWTGHRPPSTAPTTETNVS